METNRQHSLKFHLIDSEMLNLNEFADTIAALDKFYNSTARQVNHHNRQHLQLAEVQHGSIVLFLHENADLIGLVLGVLSFFLDLYQISTNKSEHNNNNSNSTTINNTGTLIQHNTYNTIKIDNFTDVSLDAVVKFLKLPLGDKATYTLTDPETDQEITIDKAVASQLTESIKTFKKIKKANTKKHKK